MPDITIDAKVAAMLAIGAINRLVNDPDVDGCCLRCCGECWALSTLLADGKLNDIVNHNGEALGYSWWIGAFPVDAGGVDIGRLAYMWRPDFCPNHEGE